MKQLILPIIPSGCTVISGQVSVDNRSADADFIISRYFALFPAPKKIFFFLQL